MFDTTVFRVERTVERSFGWELGPLPPVKGCRFRTSGANRAIDRPESVGCRPGLRALLFKYEDGAIT